MKAHRYSRSDKIDAYICDHLNDFSNLAIRFLPPVNDDRIRLGQHRFLVLKNPRYVDGIWEPGVLLIKYSETFNYFIQYMQCDELAKYFYLILEPSWSNYCTPEILYWCNFSDSPIIVEASEARDFQFLKNLNTNLKATSIGSSDWVDDRIFKPLNLDKVYDSIYVAGYTLGKRHHRFFKAISNINDAQYRAAIVCTKWGKYKKDIHNLIDYYGIRDRLDIFEGLKPIRLNELYNQAKVNILLSLIEGSNKTIFEGLFAGTPGIVLEENIGVNKRYINRQTGWLIPDSQLTSALIHFRTHWAAFNTREWASENISPLVTTNKINDLLAETITQRGGSFDRDLAVKVNSPEASLYDKSNAERLLSRAAILRIFSVDAKQQGVVVHEKLLSELG